MLKISVTGSHWLANSGWSYTEDLDSMEIDSTNEFSEAAKLYAAQFAKSYGELGENEDYQLRFYAPEDAGQENPLAKIWLSESASRIPWTAVDLVDGEGYTLTRPQAIEALRELKTTGGIHQVFVQHDGVDIDSHDQIDWAGFPEDLTAEEIEILGTMTTRDESGKHFTEVHSAEFLSKLEHGGWIEIDRPVHETGISYSQEYWHLRVTKKTENLF
jgi:hypothetical protein